MKEFFSSRRSSRARQKELRNKGGPGVPFRDNSSAILHYENCGFSPFSTALTFERKVCASNFIKYNTTLIMFKTSKIFYYDFIGYSTSDKIRFVRVKNFIQFAYICIEMIEISILDLRIIKSYLYII